MLGLLFHPPSPFFFAGQDLNDFFPSVSSFQILSASKEENLCTEEKKEGRKERQRGGEEKKKSIQPSLCQRGIKYGGPTLSECSALE